MTHINTNSISVTKNIQEPGTKEHLLEYTKNQASARKPQDDVENYRQTEQMLISYGKQKFGFF